MSDPELPEPDNDHDAAIAVPLAGTLDGAARSASFAEPGDEAAELAKWERPPFPAGCPVKPLGIASTIEGQQRCFYLDARGQIVGLEAANKHGKNSLIALFGDKSPWLEAHYPQWSKPITQYDRSTKIHNVVRASEIIGFDQADASRAMIEQCMREGRFEPAGKLRGRGAHAAGAGGMVIHYGDTVLATRHRPDGTIKDFTYFEPGMREGHVYPAADPSPRPWHVRVGAKPGQEMFRLLRTWNWKRPLLDPRFLLGWIGAAMLGGALKWRPNVWITGGSGTGKSTLNGEGGVLDLAFGSAVLRTGSASAAAIRQTLKNSTLPVLFDEIEASGDNRRVGEVIELARVSSSGSTMHRGGADHTAHEFTLRSCFQFSSINIPPLQPQDRNRLAVLELQPFPADAPPLVLRQWGVPDLARQIQRRMIDEFSRFEDQLARFQQTLAEHGHSRRACDQFGVLLAVADVLLNEDACDDEELAEWGERCAPDRVSEVSAATPDHEACLIHLLTSQVQGRGSEEREAMATWIGRAVAVAGDLDGMAHDKTADRLQQRGLKLVNARWHRAELDEVGEVQKAARWGTEAFLPGKPGFLAVAWSHRGLDEIFQGTTWQGGVWRQALARLAGALEPVMVRFMAQTLTAVLVPIARLLDEDDPALPPASRDEALAEWLAIERGEAPPF